MPHATRHKPDSPLSARLFEVFDDSGLNVRQAAKRLAGADIPSPPSYASVRNYLSGTTEPPLAVLRAAAELFGVRPEWLVLGSGPKSSGIREAIASRAGLRGSPLPPTVQDWLVIHGIAAAAESAGHIPKELDLEGYAAFVEDAGRVASFLDAYVRLPIESGIYSIPDQSESAWQSHADASLQQLRELQLRRGDQINSTLIDGVIGLVTAERNKP